jgi:osmotically-inducible protein OsmY
VERRSEKHGLRGYDMTDVRLDSNVARAIARVLRMDDVDLPVRRAFHGVLADILVTASDADEARSDAQIRRAICAQLDAEGGISSALINFSVKDGQVEIRGAITSEHDRETLLAIARTAYGVKEVHDHLVWMDRATHAFMPSPEDSCPG